jgi:cytochrome P450
MFAFGTRKLWGERNEQIGRDRLFHGHLGSQRDRLIDKFIDRGQCEFVSNYAHALSTLVIADLLGVPEEDREQLLELLGKPPTQIGGDAQDKIASDPLALLEDCFSRYMRERRDNPRGDMMSDLANARFKDGTEPELAVPVRLAKFLFGAGQDTSARLMASTFRVLGECPHLQQLLRAEPHRIPDFIEERISAFPKRNMGRRTHVAMNMSRRTFCEASRRCTSSSLEPKATTDWLQ